MTGNVEVVFLGLNGAGEQVYEWLTNREETTVLALLTTREQLSTIEQLQPNYVVSCGYRHVVPEEILDVPTEGCVNLHPAYLPYNRGANPNVWSIVEGTQPGVTLHYMDAGIDTGDIIARQTVQTNFADTGKDLHERLETAQVSLFTETWSDLIDDDVEPVEQRDREGTCHTTDEFEALCELDPEETVEVKEFLDRLRALTFPPYDNATIEIDGATYHVEVDITEA